MKWTHRLIYFLGGVPNEHLKALELEQAVRPVSTPQGVIYSPYKKPRTRSTKNKVVFCPVIDKISYIEPIAKTKAANSKIYLRAYKCEFCPYWHLTHHKSYL